jgi:hypothetical protein
MTNLRLQRVQYMPRELAPGILYVSVEYAVAGHLCACGCGNKVMTPLSPAKWQFTERNGLPSLYPSVGNWQLPCRSHYFILDGKIRWAEQWTQAEIDAGRRAEKYRLDAYYSERQPKQAQQGFWAKLEALMRQLFGP